MPDRTLGHYQILEKLGQGGMGDVWLYDLDRETLRRVTFENRAGGATWLPDGKWVAYASDESGRNEVYVAAMKGPGKWQVSNNGGTYPLWCPDGEELFYLSRNLLMSVPVHASPAGFSLGAPSILLNLENTPQAIASRENDVNPDGSYFVYTSNPAANAHRHQLSLVLNWSPGRRLVEN